MGKQVKIDDRFSKLLGAAFLFVFVASMVSDPLFTSVAGSGDLSETLATIAGNPGLVRLSSLVALINSAGIVALASLLYIAFVEEQRIMALVAFGWWLAEAVMLAASKIGAYALIPLSQEYVQAGAPAASHLQTLGTFLYHGVDRMGYEIHMLFFCLGGLLWYALFHKTRRVPRALSIWGLASISMLLVGVLFSLLDLDLGPATILMIAYAPYELVLGVWLMVKGFSASANIAESVSV
jgi:hypothetical protein